MLTKSFSFYIFCKLSLFIFIKYSVYKLYSYLFNQLYNIKKYKSNLITSC